MDIRRRLAVPEVRLMIIQRACAILYPKVAGGQCSAGVPDFAILLFEGGEVRNTGTERSRRFRGTRERFRGDW